MSALCPPCALELPSGRRIGASPSSSLSSFYSPVFFVRFFFLVILPSHHPPSRGAVLPPCRRLIASSPCPSPEGPRSSLFPPDDFPLQPPRMARPPFFLACAFRWNHPAFVALLSSPLAHFRSDARRPDFPFYRRPMRRCSLSQPLSPSPPPSGDFAVWLVEAAGTRAEPLLTDAAPGLHRNSLPSASASCPRRSRPALPFTSRRLCSSSRTPRSSPASSTVC